MDSMRKRIIFSAFIIAAAGIFLLWRLMYINLNSSFYLSYDMSAPRKVTVVCSYGDIYDRNGKKLVNRTENYIAVINPQTADKEAIEPHVIDTEKYESCIDGNALFLCSVDSQDIPSVTAIPVCERYDGSLCTHIIGYTSDGKGVCGLEKAYDEILRQPKSSVTLSYSVDAGGDLLEGEGIGMKWQNSYMTGVRTGIDISIQTACENAMRNVKKGAAVVMDISTGEICAVVSKPDYDPSHPEYSLDSEGAPFVNRAFSAYSVGSIFKLVTAGAALEYGISDEYCYDCSGSISVYGQEFDCHLFGGHGTLDMRRAIVESCNPYFICLSKDIPTDFLHSFAQRLGFGKSSRLSKGISSSSGYLTSARELLVPAEKANFSFGQGKLTATPLQITMLTAAIANGGQMPDPILVHGSTDSARGYEAASASAEFARVMKRSTADKLKSFMTDTVYKENSAAVPEFTTAGGKTSTAQTWTYNEYGNENLNCWFTGFFPADEPHYAVTVMIEEGVSGNYTCGPVFREIADSVRMGRYANIE